MQAIFAYSNKNFPYNTKFLLHTKSIIVKLFFDRRFRLIYCTDALINLV